MQVNLFHFTLHQQWSGLSEKIKCLFYQLPLHETSFLFFRTISFSKSKSNQHYLSHCQLSYHYYYLCLHHFTHLRQCALLKTACSKLLAAALDQNCTYLPQNYLLPHDCCLFALIFPSQTLHLYQICYSFLSQLAINTRVPYSF